MIGGFEAPTSGLIELKGEDVTWLPPYKRNVNTVFQNYALFPHLTIYENVAFGLRRTKVGDAEVRTRVTDMLKLVELPGFERRKPTQLSGGQAQRVALARALINRPSVLLLDEPLGALDLKLRKQMQIELKRIQQEVGITFIFVTHDQEEAMTMSDRIAVMNHGQIRAAGRSGGPVRASADPLRRRVPRRQQPPARRPRRASTATTPSSEARGRRPRVRVPAALTEGLAGFEIGVRPEKIRLLELTDPVPDGVNQLLGTVRDVSYLGVSHELHRRDPRRRLVTVYEQNVQRATRAELWEPGEEVRLVWSPDHTFAVEAGGEPPPDLPVAGVLAAGGAPLPPPPGGSRDRRFVIGGALAVAARRASGPSCLHGRQRHASPAAVGQRRAGIVDAAARAARRGSVRERRGAAPSPIASRPPATGTLRFANWRATWTSTRTTNGFPTLERFTKETGIEVDYVEAIDGNETFFTAQLPAARAGLPTELGHRRHDRLDDRRLIRLGWLEKIDKANAELPGQPARHLPRTASGTRTTTSPRRGNPGMTGLGYDKKKTGDAGPPRGPVRRPSTPAR